MVAPNRQQNIVHYRCQTGVSLWVYVQDSACVLSAIYCASENLDRATTTTASSSTTAIGHLRRSKGYA
jgi:hypothetical protein